MLSFFRAHRGSRATHVVTRRDRNGDTRTSSMCSEQSSYSIAFTGIQIWGEIVMQEQQTEKTTVARPRKNVAGGVRLVSEPVPLVGPGLRIRSDMIPKAQELVSERKGDQNGMDPLACTLVRDRMYSDFMERAKAAYTPAPITFTDRELILASGVSFLAGIGINVAVVMTGA